MSVAISSSPSVKGQAEQCRRLARVLTMTRQMIAHADAGKWRLVAELERERRQDLSLCFAQSASSHDADLIAEALAAVLHLNEELMARLKTARAEALESGIRLARNRSAVEDYSAVQVSNC